MSANENIRRVQAVMSHPDDAEILVAGTLHHLRARGWKVEIVTMTSGDCGSISHTKNEITTIRKAEAEAGADYLGASYRCAGLWDGEVLYAAEALRKVVELMRVFDPDIVITHSPVDYMVDHEKTSRLARAAAFLHAAPLYETKSSPASPVGRGIPALYYADPVEGVGPMGDRIQPHFYVDISRQMTPKKEMLSCHASQREWLRRYHGIDEYLDRMEKWAARYGQEVGVAYAEGFRQHLGHAYPHSPILQEALEPYVRVR